MAAAAPLATQISRNCSPILSFQPNSAFAAKTTSWKRLSVLRLRASSKPERDQTADDEAKIVSQEDVKYLVQLGAGSVAGAAAIKYGTVLFPEITKPNLAQALFMISAPLFVAVLLLFKQSRVVD
ncbi:homoserine O-acetyltransferase [Perilla frutescens var. hirtella]|nr:homoserine O-acetyltransferase [Perilla frutescens var. hirtella]KAH6811272.1 homoserine O-acetyltransferase [Perilla frutescens var. frutescens]